MIRTNLGTVAAIIASRQEFKGSNMHGVWYEADTIIPTGILPAAHREQLERESKGTRVYVVYSWETPIAWCANDKWTVPTVRYTQTTTKHQNKLPAHNSMA